MQHTSKGTTMHSMHLHVITWAKPAVMYILWSFPDLWIGKSLLSRVRRRKLLFDQHSNTSFSTPGLSWTAIERVRG